MYVVVEELIPEMSEEPHSDIGTLVVRIWIYFNACIGCSSWMMAKNCAILTQKRPSGDGHKE